MTPCMLLMTITPTRAPARVKSSRKWTKIFTMNPESKITWFYLNKLGMSSLTHLESNWRIRWCSYLKNYVLRKWLTFSASFLSQRKWSNSNKITYVKCLLQKSKLVLPNLPNFFNILLEIVKILKFHFDMFRYNFITNNVNNNQGSGWLIFTYF